MTVEEKGWNAEEEALWQQFFALGEKKDALFAKMEPYKKECERIAEQDGKIDETNSYFREYLLLNEELRDLSKRSIEIMDKLVVKDPNDPNSIQLTEIMDKIEDLNNDRS
jgi:hypothetical protein